MVVIISCEVIAVMPVSCTFQLNDKETSFLSCPGAGNFVAFSGTSTGRDNPSAVSKVDVGPIPPGTYYIVDRQSGGTLGWLRDLYSAFGYGTTDRSQWFALWRENTGDVTIINGIKRGAFRLHPMGPRHLSEGCITLANPYQFKTLANYLRKQGATLRVPGAALKAYGTVIVK